MKTMKMIKSSVALLLALCLPLTAVEHVVQVDSSGFSPVTLQIVEGDTVTWENTDLDDFSHTITSTLPILDPDYWNNIVVAFGDTFSKTFNTTGTFTYFDQFDLNTGTITVVAALAPVPVPVSDPRIAAGKFLFDATPLTVGSTNILQTSTNLVNWTALSTNLNTSATMTFTNDVDGMASYFRVFELPIP